MEKATQQITLVNKNSQEKKQQIIKKLLDFFVDDVGTVIDYINDPDAPIPVEHITPSKRIDLHPTREYLLRLPRILNELEMLEQKMEGEDDPLEDIYN